MTMLRESNQLRYWFLKTGLVFLATIVLASLNTTVLAKEKPSLIGDWTLNPELTEKRRPKQEKASRARSGFGTNVVVATGGVLMPVPTQTSPTASGPTANLPAILGCKQMAISQQASDILVTCPELFEPRIFQIGKVHGRTVRWSNRSLSEKYSSTSRRVTHEFKLERSGLLAIEITVKPKGQKRLKYVLVFDRAPEST